jgi:isopenicillin N synthase-like dioxygenase
VSIRSTRLETYAEETRFFTQSEEDKMKVSQSFSRYFNGYKGPRTTNISPGESVDVKETVCESLLFLVPANEINSWAGDILHNMTPIQNLLMTFLKK